MGGNSQPTRFNPFGDTVTEGVEYSPVAHGGSVYFDGTGDWVTGTGSYTLGNTYTIEMWFYTNTVAATNGGLINLATSSTTNPGINIYRSSAEIICNDGTTVGTGPSSGAGTVTINAWTHLAIVADGTNTKLYLDGVLKNTYVGTTGSTSVLNFVTIGSFNDKAAPFNGYISGLRIIKTAIYTSAFVPPAAPADPIPGTTLLVNGTNAAIQDKTGRNVIIPGNYAHNYVDTANVKYGSGSLYLNGGTTKLTIPNSDLFVIEKEFTFECWVYPTAYTEAINCMLGKYGNWYWGIYGGASAGLMRMIGSGGSGVNSTTAGAVPLNTWSHVAICRDSSNNVRQFVNGQQSGNTTSYTLSLTNTADLAIGSYTPTSSSYRWYGYIDDLRMSRVARYTSNFTPPARAFLK